MTEHDIRINELLKSSNELRNRSFEECKDELREQLMANREAIEAYSTWNKSANYDTERLELLKETQISLERFFHSNWNYKIENPNEMLQFDRVYSSQTFILVEWHAGSAFHHLLKRHFKFEEAGFFNLTVERASKSQNEVADRLKTMKTDFRNIYAVEEDRTLKMQSRGYEFEGTIIRDAIVGKGIKIGAYRDGIVTDKDEILVAVNTNEQRYLTTPIR